MAKNKNSKIDYKKIKEFIKTPRGRGILFFAAYFLFFVAVILVVRLSTPGEVIGTGFESGNPYRFSIANIMNDNYQFDYTVTVDDNTINYQGKRDNDVELFNYQDALTNSNYYRSGNNYLIQNGGLWLKSENPYKYLEFMDIDKISELLKSATYISKTEYESGKEIYNFGLSTVTIMKVLENIDIDISEIPNEIVLITDEDGYTNEIQFKLDSYCSYKKICNKKMEIVLKYDQYGKIEKIASPIQ